MLRFKLLVLLLLLLGFRETSYSKEFDIVIKASEIKRLKALMIPRLWTPYPRPSEKKIFGLISGVACPKETIGREECLKGLIMESPSVKSKAIGKIDSSAPQDSVVGFISSTEMNGLNPVFHFPVYSNQDKWFQVQTVRLAKPYGWILVNYRKGQYWQPDASDRSNLKSYFSCHEIKPKKLKTKTRDYENYLIKKYAKKKSQNKSYNLEPKRFLWLRHYPFKIYRDPSKKSSLLQIIRKPFDLNYIQLKNGNVWLTVYDQKGSWLQVWSKQTRRYGWLKLAKGYRLKSVKKLFSEVAVETTGEWNRSTYISPSDNPIVKETLASESRNYMAIGEINVNRVKPRRVLAQFNPRRFLNREERIYLGGKVGKSGYILEIPPRWKIPITFFPYKKSKTLMMTTTPRLPGLYQKGLIKKRESKRSIPVFEATKDCFYRVKANPLSKSKTRDGWIHLPREPREAYRWGQFRPYSEFEIEKLMEIESAKKGQGQDSSVRVVDTKILSGKLWLKVILYKKSKCGELTGESLGSGWVPYTGAGGPNFRTRIVNLNACN